MLNEFPNNVTLKKRQKPSAFYDRCQPSGWAPINIEIHG